MPSSTQALQQVQLQASQEATGLTSEAGHADVASGLQECSSSVALLHPGAKDSFLCFCRGAVVKMLGHYGWVLAFGRVNHPLATKRNGLIYVSSDDIVHGRMLKAGDIVTFYLYVDAMGLGAEYCDIEQSADTNCDHGKLQGSNSKSHWIDSAPRQLQPDAVYYVPVAYMVTNTPYACPETDHATPSRLSLPASERTDLSHAIAIPTKDELVHKSAEADEKLPSVGSAGHYDGTCKRCAFFPKGRCLNGADCTHCHFHHVPHKRTRKFKPGQTGTRQRFNEAPDSVSQPGDTGSDAGVTVIQVESEDAASLERLDSDAQLDDSPEVELDDEFDVDERGSNEYFADEVKEVCAMSDFDSTHTEVETTTPSTSVLSDDEDGRSSSTMSPISWSESQRIRRATMSGSSGEAPPAEVARMARALLNKLTEDRFEPITNQILALPFSGQEQLAAVTVEIFGKATMQCGFRSLYVELCVRLDAHLAVKGGDVGGKAFRKSLVAECQRIFEKSLEPHDAVLFENMTGDERFELENKLKTARLGNMRFIGDLMVRQLLAPKLMMPIIHELLNGDESALESLIAFLGIVGPTFEKKSSLYRAPLQDVFATLRRKKTDVQISPRVRFLLSDLFDAREKDLAARQP
jgi:hypothetical protein